MSKDAPHYWSPERISFSVSGAETSDQGEITIDRPYAILGSGKDCDVVLNSKRVPRLAMLFVATSRGLRVSMLSPHSKCSGQCLRVEPDHPIRIGSFEISVRAHSEQDDPPHKPSHEDDEALFLATWRCGDHRRFLKLPNESPITIGRKAPAHLLIKDDRMSGQHCSLFRVADTLWVIDLQSANGTLVASKEIQCEPLGVGQSLLAGTNRIHFTRLHTDDKLETLETNLRGKSNQHHVELHEMNTRETNALESLAQASAAERSVASRLEQSQIATQKIEAVSQDLKIEITELDGKLSKALAERDEAASQLQKSNEETRALQKELEESKVRAEALEREVAETTELLNDKESLRQRELQLETLQRELALERQILHELQLGVAPNADPNRDTLAPEEESVISAFDFQDVLAEALEGLPSIDED